MLFGIIICLVSVILLGIDGRFVTPTVFPQVSLNPVSVVDAILMRIPFFRSAKPGPGCCPWDSPWPMGLCLAKCGACTGSPRRQRPTLRFVRSSIFTRSQILINIYPIVLLVLGVVNAAEESRTLEAVHNGHGAAVCRPDNPWHVAIVRPAAKALGGVPPGESTVRY